MSIYKSRVSVQRLEATTGIKFDYADQGGEHICSIQPLDDMTAVTLGFALERTFKIYFPDEEVDVIISDKLIDEESNEYTVKGVKRYQLANGVGHTEVTAEQVD